MDELEPCNSFKEWLEKNPHYQQYPDDILWKMNNVWNAGWNEGWKRLAFWIKKNDGQATD